MNKLFTPNGTPLIKAGDKINLTSTGLCYMGDEHSGKVYTVSRLYMFDVCEDGYENCNCSWGIDLEEFPCKLSLFADEFDIVDLAENQSNAAKKIDNGKFRAAKD